MTRASSARAGADERLSALYGSEALERLRSREVVVVAAGLLGGIASLELGMLGIPQRIVEPGRVEAANTGQQLLPWASLERPKGAVRAEQIAALNPAARVRVVEARVEELGLAALAGVDLILSGLDSRAARMRVALLSQRLGLPWLDASVDGSGERLFGTLALYDGSDPRAACYACRYAPRDLARIASEGRGPGCPSWRDAAAPAAPPTLSAASFGAVVAGFQVLWAIRVLQGRAAELRSRQLQISADGEPRLRSVALGRNERCLLGHQRLAPLRDGAGATVGELFAAAAAELGAAPARLRLHERVLVLGLVCPACRERQEVARLREAFAAAELRCGCEAGALRVPVRMQGALEAADAERLAGERWGALGFPEADVVSAIASDGREIHYRVNA